MNFTTAGVTTYVLPGWGGTRLLALRCAYVEFGQRWSLSSPAGTANKGMPAIMMFPVWQNCAGLVGVRSIADGNSAAAAAAVSISLTNTGASHPWNDYRYEVFETVVSLHNVTIRRIPEEC